MRLPSFAFGTVVTLSTISREAVSRPFTALGSTSNRNSGARESTGGARQGRSRRASDTIKRRWAQGAGGGEVRGERIDIDRPEHPIRPVSQHGRAVATVGEERVYRHAVRCGR